ncbi:MAG: heparinase II/III family protein [Gemmatimonadetes bacterium]|nr:heparinase II/III family protein [Gemmatimonadota bacterium]
MSLLIGVEDLETRRSEIAASADLVAVEARLSAALGAFLDRPLYVPEAKAILSRWGSLCRDDGAELGFDPFSPHAQRCTACERIWSTEQSHGWWVYWYQLWLAERVWQCALRSGPGGDSRTEERVLEALALVIHRYTGYPNADNVLGPSRPFFSTYLESIWVLQLAAAASLLEAMGRLPVDLAHDLRTRLFRPSAELIADFDEGRSNRQVWNVAALHGLGRVLGDAAMVREATHGPSGLLASLDGGLLADGLWYEGENYHWFALRGLVWGAEMLRTAGDIDLWTDAGKHGTRFRAAFRAPVLTALPDFTFPARRDSKYGVSLRQRRMAELWEIALARARPGAGGPAGEAIELASLLAHVYDPTVLPRDEAEREITEVERAEPPTGVRRGMLGWKGLLWMLPELPAADPEAWRPGTVHLEATGLAIFRQDGDECYVGLDYGEPGGGHGHPDRLNLTVHANGIPWLMDFGTGSYVSPNLAWYRTTAAHNAPLLDGVSQATARGECIAFEELVDFGWVCAQLPEGSAYDGATLQRTLVVTPWYVLDVLQMGSEAGERTLALPWHGLGRATADEHGMRFDRAEGELRVYVTGRQPFQIQMASAPGPPVGASGATPPDLAFPVVVSTAEEVTLVACLDLSGKVAEIECVESDYLVRLASDQLHTHRPTETGWSIDLGHGDPIELGGLREPAGGELGVPAASQLTTASIFGDAVRPRRPDGAEKEEPAATCYRIDEPPALDGTLDGFRLEPSLAIDQAHQFRRAEEPWQGPERFAAHAYLNTDGERLYLGIDVTAPDPVFRPGDAPDPELENENPDIHSDGLQVYVETTMFYGWLIVPDAEDRSRVRVSAVRGTDAEPEMVVEGAWMRTPRGYRVTLAIETPDEELREFGFDVYVNRARHGRERRVGQLIWSGARGARLYLAGDRPMPGPLPRVRVQ